MTIEITDQMLAKIEKILNKWSLTKIKTPERIIIQKSPEGMTIGNTETYHISFTTKYPASPYLIQQELRRMLGVPDNYILVNPIENGEILDPTQHPKSDGSILLDPFYTKDTKTNPDDYHGTEYNKGLITSLKQLREEERKKKGQDLGPIGEYTKEDPIKPIGSIFGDKTPNNSIPQIKDLISDKR